MERYYLVYVIKINWIVYGNKEKPLYQYHYKIILLLRTATDTDDYLDKTLTA